MRLWARISVLLLSGALAGRVFLVASLAHVYQEVLCWERSACALAAFAAAFAALAFGGWLCLSRARSRPLLVALAVLGPGLGVAANLVLSSCETPNGLACA